MIIDCYTHLISRRVGKILLKHKYYGPGKQMGYPEDNGDAGARLALMDKYGVDVQVLTQTTPVLLGFNAVDAAEICRLSNDDNYALCKAYPKKFINVCMLSLLNVKDACKELERCIKELDCRGVTISSNQNGVGLDSRDYDPVYKILEKHQMPILIHPTHWESYPLATNENAWKLMGVFGWPFDTTQAVWRMIFGGVFDRFPGLQVVTHHLGGMFPYFARRAESNARRVCKGVTKNEFMYYWKNNLWGDTALSGTRAALPCGYAFFGAERMLFATDYPFGEENGEDYIREGLAG
ncbi:amidohydrolase family protein, partial [Chloroflexota bacterium]